MRKAASCAPIGSASSTLELLSYAGRSRPLLCQTPSALVHQSNLIWPSQNRATSSKAARQFLRWNIGRGETSGAVDPYPASKDDGLLGQEDSRKPIQPSAHALSNEAKGPNNSWQTAKCSAARAAASPVAMQTRLRLQPRLALHSSGPKSTARIEDSYEACPDPLATISRHTARLQRRRHAERRERGKHARQVVRGLWLGPAKRFTRRPLRRAGVDAAQPRSPRGPRKRAQRAHHSPPSQLGNGLIAHIQAYAATAFAEKGNPITMQRDNAELDCMGVMPHGTVLASSTARPPIDPHDSPKSLSEWERLAAHVNKTYNQELAWESLQPLREEEQSLLAHPDADQLRAEFLDAAAGSDTRIDEVVGIASALRDQFGFEWPDLYGNVVYRLLDRAEPARAVSWHSRLYFLFRPSPSVFTSLLSHFIVDSDPKMQRALMELHHESEGAKLYDSIIGQLFERGQSGLAKVWRKQLITTHDFPMSKVSKPFIRFLSAYYPSIKLTPEELNLLDPEWSPLPHVAMKSEAELEAIKASIQGDHMVAKWFASPWTSVEFAIELVQRFGVRTLGPLALQSLGIRDPGSKKLADHVAQMQGLGLAIAPLTYCEVLVHFARTREDDLLADLLGCDLHPDEFEDIETVRMLMAAAERRQDVRQQRLMRKVESVMRKLAADTQHTKSQPTSAVSTVSGEHHLGQTTAQMQAMEILTLAFDRVKNHPRDWVHRRHEGARTRLDEASLALRHAVAADAAIPFSYWRRLLHNLGRLGYVEALEIMSLEFVSIYSASQHRLIPVHADDIPTPLVGGKNASKQGAIAGGLDGVNGLEMWQLALCGQADKAPAQMCIPSDLPFSHQHHPVRRMFHGRMQRAIVRWGFDVALKRKHHISGASWRDQGIRSNTMRASQIQTDGLERGLRILAKLRDAGVCIDVQLVRSEVVRRLISAEFTGRERAAWMDRHELSSSYMMRITKEAWGSCLFDSKAELEQMVLNGTSSAQRHYWKAFFGSTRSGRFLPR